MAMLIARRASGFVQQRVAFKPALVARIRLSNQRLAPVGAVPEGSIDLFVGGLQRDIQKSEIEQLFTPYGPVERVDMGDRAFMGFAGVLLPAAGAENAIKELNGKEVSGRAIRVEKRKSKEEAAAAKAATREAAAARAAARKEAAAATAAASSKKKAPEQ